MRPRSLNYLFLLGILALLLGQGSVSVFAGEQSSSPRTFKVTGLDCEMCPKMVKKAVEKIPGVEKVEVELIGKDVKEGAILKVVAPASVTDAQVIEAVKKADKNFSCERLPQ